MKRIILGLCLLALIGAALFLVVTRPTRVDAAAVTALSGDATHGEQVFWAGGCASCHAADKAEGDALLVLSGGKRFVTDFGTFIAPNISPDPTHGIGGWTTENLANAMLHGTSPEGEHYYPAFPYASYIHASLQDITDLKAYLDTLPASDRANEPHAVGFPFNIRLALGGWKFLFLNDTPAIAVEGLTDSEKRGQYLVEGLGHCGECHTPRNALGGRQMSRWLAGAPNPDGEGKIPNITPAKLTWSEADIAEYLTSGFTPEFDSVGGSMAEVVTNTSHLAPEDRAAIAAYLKKVPAAE